MDFSFWNITLKNGKEYLIKDKESNVRKFMETIAKDNNWRDFLLVNNKEINGIKINTVMIKTDDISSVEYCGI